jgi:hypothetical protein
MQKNIILYGAGTNSTAMAIDMLENGMLIDAIVFADTGGERPDTYRGIDEFNRWLVTNGAPGITIVRNNVAVGDDKIANTLEQECLMRKQLPGIIYGSGSCSDKWKKRPFQEWLKKTEWQDITVFIGFDAGEPHRAERGDLFDDGYKKRYWLIERSIYRKGCIDIIDRAGIKPPGKSACFFCPSSKKHEILALPENLKERAIKLEQNADLTKMKGLGRNWSWKELIEYDKAQSDIFETTIGIPCDCWDGA